MQHGIKRYDYIIILDFTYGAPAEPLKKIRVHTLLKMCDACINFKKEYK